MNRETSSSGRDHSLRLILAWIYVGIPLLWGVIETGANALKLFQ